MEYEYKVRQLKKAMRKNKMLCPIYEAHNWGEYHAIEGKPKRNNYPKGVRHAAYERAYNEADPLGDWHGINE